ncbi:helix-turn-helix domain-containing protein [Nonomuraea sp. NPDC026600]|uniref:TetR/AcrR family transcriptional regulator n=1 Tax=Nonomuraea sp. NPDC026600 TaxID=3155363 RepID=UPI0033DAF10A
MDAPVGLRERKKERTRRLIADTALRLFLERGFDAVSVNDVAVAAEVSKPTLFRYFASKDDLVLARFADHQGEAARVVRARAVGQTPVAALRDHFLAGLRDRDPITGLNDAPSVLAFQHLIYTTPSLETRLLHHTGRDIDLLTAALRETGHADVGDVILRLVATHLITVQQVLGRENWRKIVSGRTADDACPEALADADQAYTVLAAGLDAALFASATPTPPTPHST